MEKICKNCKYYIPSIYRHYGTCRFYPPSIMPSTLGKSETIKPIGVFPIIEDDEWCGKFEAREEATQE